MQNDKLYSLLLAFTKKSLEIIKTKYDEQIKLDPDKFIETKTNWVKNSQEIYERQEVEQIDWGSMIVSRARQEMEEYLRSSIQKTIPLLSEGGNIKKEIDWDTIIFPTYTDN